MDEKPRCLRCRGTFGFEWCGSEPIRQTYEEAPDMIKDFEGVWTSKGKEKEEKREAQGWCGEYEVYLNKDVE
jgi:hypothetical protein